MAIGHAHRAWRGGDRLASPVKPMRKACYIFKFASIGTSIHPQAAANRSWNANQKLQTGNAGLLCIARHIGIGCAGLGNDARAVMADGIQMGAKLDHDASNTAITNQQIRSGANGN